MPTNFSRFRRPRFLAVALALALVAAACGGGDESVSSRTRNAGAAPTWEECVAAFGDEMSPEEQRELLQIYNDHWARFEEGIAEWAQHSQSIDEQGEIISGLLVAELTVLWKMRH